MDYQNYFCFLWYFTFAFCGILLLLFAVKISLQIPQNHLVIVADGVSVQAGIVTDISFQFPDFFHPIIKQ